MDSISYERGIVQRNNIFNVTIEDNTIFQIPSWNSQKTPIGVTMQKYNELKNIADEYYNILIEKGIIEKPKTPEEIAKEQQQIMMTMIEQMKSMQEEINNLKQTEKKEDTINIMENISPLDMKEDKKDNKKLLNFK